jgi:predicted GIY-YIG superfamily endonuclease
MHNGEPYVSATAINDIYKTIGKKYNSTQKKLIDDLKLKSYIIVCRRAKDKTKLGQVISNVLNQFKSQVHVLYLLISELEQINEGPDMNNHIELLRLIKLLPDIISTVEPTVEPTESTPVHTDSNLYLNSIEMPLIVLEESEMFRDVNDQVVNIEIRGERGKDKILFKAKDVANYFEMKLFTKHLLQANTSYQIDIDYVILQDNPQTQCAIRDSKDKTVTTTPIINHERIYLTLTGYIRSATISRSGNANMSKVLDWIQTLVYVHQFGSPVERNELAQGLLKTILNDKVSGLYYIDLGTIEELSDSMGITNEYLQNINSTYSLSKCAKYRVGKYGISNDISTRLTQHQNQKSGYGQWTNNIQIKFIAMISETQLYEAESLLKNMFKAKEYSFQYTDPNGKQHNELVLVGPKDDNKLKTIYKQILTFFPSKENELCKLIADSQTKFEHTLLKLEYDYEMKLNSVHAELAESKKETMAAQYETKLTTANTQIEILLLKLQLAELKGK